MLGHCAAAWAALGGANLNRVLDLMMSMIGVLRYGHVDCWRVAEGYVAGDGVLVTGQLGAWAQHTLLFSTQLMFDLLQVLGMWQGPVNPNPATFRLLEAHRAR